jgi:hypothetical protein
LPTFPCLPINCSIWSKNISNIIFPIQPNRTKKKFFAINLKQTGKDYS